MSVTDHTLPDDGMPEAEGLAAEYVLGTLPLADRLAAERRIASDPDFAATVMAWQNRLAPLNDDYAPMTPPDDLLARVEARLFPVAKARRAPWRSWLGALAGLALASAVAFVVLPPLQRPAPVVATLTAENQPLVFAASYQADTHRLTVTRSAGDAAEAGRDYELWIIPAGQKPISLGVVGAGEHAVELAALPAGSTLAVTLEPQGGSPSGDPTGPVVAAAVIAG